MADWAMFVSLPSIKYPLQQYKVVEAQRDNFEEDFEFLLKRGCDQQALETSLRMAKTVRVNVMPKADRVKSVAKQMRALAKEISRLEGLYFLVAQEFEELRTETKPNTLHNPFVSRESDILHSKEFLAEFLYRRPEVDGWPSDPETFHDILMSQRNSGLLSKRFPHFALPELLNRRARMYDDWSKGAQSKVPPRADLLDQVKRMCPALYVKWATGGRPFCDRVANLLRLTGIANYVNGTGLGGTQLNREIARFEANYQLTTSEIRRLLQRVHRRELTWPTVTPAGSAYSHLHRVESSVPKTPIRRR